MHRAVLLKKVIYTGPVSVNRSSETRFDKMPGKRKVIQVGFEAPVLNAREIFPRLLIRISSGVKSFVFFFEGAEPVAGESKTEIAECFFVEDMIPPR